LMIWDNLEKSGRFFFKGDARNDRHDLYARKLFCCCNLQKKFLFLIMGKRIKSSKEKYFKYIRPRQQQQQQQQQQPPQNDLLVRSLNVAAELFTAGIEAVTLQRETEEQLQEQQQRHQQEQDELNEEIARLTREIRSVEAQLSFLQQNHDRAQRRHIMRDNSRIAQIAEIQSRLFGLQEENQRLQRRARGRGHGRRHS
jgi:peptidoglycan hydrolase-like amidase